MGLNLLGVVTIPLPSLFADVDVRRGALPSALKAYAAGLTFALAASPCSTPVLATLLGYVAQTQDPARGASLLLAYTRRAHAWRLRLALASCACAAAFARRAPAARLTRARAQRLRHAAAGGGVGHERADARGCAAPLLRVGHARQRGAAGGGRRLQRSLPSGASAGRYVNTPPRYHKNPLGPARSLVSRWQTKQNARPVHHAPAAAARRASVRRSAGRA